MFNTYVARNQTSEHHHNHRATITEIKAPTDDSMKLLKEYQEKPLIV